MCHINNKFERILPELKAIIYKCTHTFKMKYVYEELLRKTRDVANFLEKYDSLSKDCLRLTRYSSNKLIVLHIDCIWIRIIQDKVDCSWRIEYCGDEFIEEPEEITPMLLSNIVYSHIINGIIIF